MGQVPVLFFAREVQDCYFLAINYEDIGRNILRSIIKCMRECF